MKIKIEVTQNDLNNGVRCAGWQCPVHLALWRATGQRWDVGVRSATAIEGSPKRTIQFSDEVCALIYDFDNGLPVRPITFEVEIPPQEVSVAKA